MFSDSTNMGVYSSIVGRGFIVQQVCCMIRDGYWHTVKRLGAFGGLIMIRLWGLWGKICGEMMLGFEVPYLLLVLYVVLGIA